MNIIFLTLILPTPCAEIFFFLTKFFWKKNIFLFFFNFFNNHRYQPNELYMCIKIYQYSFYDVICHLCTQITCTGSSERLPVQVICIYFLFWKNHIWWFIKNQPWLLEMCQNMSKMHNIMHYTNIVFTIILTLFWHFKIFFSDFFKYFCTFLFFKNQILTIKIFPYFCQTQHIICIIMANLNIFNIIYSIFYIIPCVALIISQNIWKIPWWCHHIPHWPILGPIYTPLALAVKRGPPMRGFLGAELIVH